MPTICARIEDALEVFRKTKGRPTLIILDSHIGYGSPHKIDTAAAHGEPLGEDEVRLVKRAYGWPEDAKFLVPDGVMEHFDAGIGARGAAARRRWEELFADYRTQFPELAAEIDQMQRRELPAGWDRNLPSFRADPKGIAGRDASGEVLNVLAQNIPWFLGGSADLGPSNKTMLKFDGAGDFEAGSPGGRNLHFGIREHAMAAIVNGLSLSKLRAFGATFFIFSDYARPAIRLSALMELPTIFVFTHDAMGDGEDGPTHQPVEQLVSLRAIPGLVVLRPGDANEVVEAYRYILQLRHQPAVIALSRQPLPTFDRGKYASAAGVARGAYVMADAPGGPPEIILIASGSEVSLIVEAHEALVSRGIRSRVVSMPSWDIFEHQPQAYREEVLPPGVKARIAIEQGSVLGWDRYVGARRPRHRHEDLRRLGTAQGAAAQVRLRARAGRRGGHGAARAQVRSAGGSRSHGEHRTTKAVAKAETVAVAPPCAMVIFGAGGDLTKRLVTPALYNLVTAKRLPDGFRLIGVDHGNRTVDDWRKSLTDMMNEFVAKRGGEFQADHIDQTAWRWLTDRMTYLQGDFEDPKTYSRLKEHLAGLDKTAGTAATISSISLSPSAFSASSWPRSGRRTW